MTLKTLPPSKRTSNKHANNGYTLDFYKPSFHPICVIFASIRKQQCSFSMKHSVFHLSLILCFRREKICSLSFHSEKHIIHAFNSLTIFIISITCNLKSRRLLLLHSKTRVLLKHKICKRCFVHCHCRK